MTRDDLDRLREGWDFEARRAGGRDGRGAVPASLWETYSAMANTEGGLILLGAKERADGSLESTGIAEVDKLESAGKIRDMTYTPAGRDAERPLASQTALSFPQSAANSPQSAASSPQSAASSPQDAERSARTARSGRVGDARWARAADVRDAVLDLCRDRFRTVEEIATALNRSRATIQQNYVAQLVREGRLDRRYPRSPNHPQQAYRTAALPEDEP
ncbi:MAG: hypothetical protein H6706_05425 [Myxococcales bacterium]|nr:hypothetical protein [Myxococcales bacterium]